MQHNDGKHAAIDGVMSNLEFFASAPIGIARRALALARVIIDGRRDDAPEPPGSPGPAGKPDTGATAEQPEPAAAAGDGASEPPATPSAAAPEQTHAGHDPQAKTTAETVRAIRRTYDGSRASAIELGNRYGMTAGNVERIARRASWKQLPAEPGEYVPAAPATPATAATPGGYKPRRKVDDDTVLAIRREFGRTPAKTLAERHGTSVQTIRDIGNRRTRKDVSPPNAGSGPQQPEEASGPDRTPKAGTPAAAQKPARRLQDVEDTDLSERQVREIRRYAKTAGRTNGTVAKLADEFDVPPATIDAVLERRAWSNLQPRDDEYDPLGESVWNGRTPLS